MVVLTNLNPISTHIDAGLNTTLNKVSIGAYQTHSVGILIEDHITELVDKFASCPRAKALLNAASRYLHNHHFQVMVTSLPKANIKQFVAFMKYFTALTEHNMDCKKIKAEYSEYFPKSLNPEKCLYWVNLETVNPLANRETTQIDSLISQLYHSRKIIDINREVKHLDNQPKTSSETSEAELSQPLDKTIYSTKEIFTKFIDSFVCDVHETADHCMSDWKKSGIDYKESPFKGFSKEFLCAQKDENGQIQGRPLNDLADIIGTLGKAFRKAKRAEEL